MSDLNKHIQISKILYCLSMYNVLRLLMYYIQVRKRKRKQRKSQIFRTSKQQTKIQTATFWSLLSVQVKAVVYVYLTKHHEFLLLHFKLVCIIAPLLLDFNACLSNNFASSKFVYSGKQHNHAHFYDQIAQNKLNG